jgi:hypothetical protein
VQVLGQEAIVRRILLWLLANGLVLLESLPGLTITCMVTALAGHLDSCMNRVQFTPTCCRRIPAARQSSCKTSKQPPTQVGALHLLFRRTGGVVKWLRHGLSIPPKQTMLC